VSPIPLYMVAKAEETTKTSRDEVRRSHDWSVHISKVRVTLLAKVSLYPIIEVSFRLA
jgi:hypothetical protein